MQSWNYEKNRLSYSLNIEEAGEEWTLTGKFTVKYKNTYKKKEQNLFQMEQKGQEKFKT